MKRFARYAQNALIAAEWIVTTIPFLLAWWGSAIYRSILAGWEVSGLPADEKKKAIGSLLGRE